MGDRPMKKCPGCGADVEPIDQFPGGYDLACWAKRPEANRPMTAQDIRRQWGGR